jgi:hypothetical protein
MANTNQVASTSTVNTVAVLTYDAVPTITSGFGGAGSQVLGNQANVFRVIMGNTAANTGVLTFPVAPNGWLVQGYDITNGTTLFLQQTAYTTTTATINSYSITTGLAANMSAGDTLIMTAISF